MPRKRRLARARNVRVRLDPAALAVLWDRELAAEDLHDWGWWDFWYRFHPEDASPVGPALRDIWFEHRAEILEEWVRERPGTRPTHWWRWDAREPRDPIETELEYLERHQLVTAAERRALRRVG